MLNSTNWLVKFLLILEFLNSDASRDLVPFVQFKKLEKHSWGSVNFSEVAGFQHQNRATPHI